MGFPEAFAGAEEASREVVRRETFGHLAPNKGVEYVGTLRFAVGIFGSDNINPTMIAFDFADANGEELDSSPWLFDTVADALSLWSKGDAPSAWPVIEAGGIYEWSGTIKNYKLHGVLRKMELS